MTRMASLYRRHRPQTFADVVGQPAIVRTLSNAIANDKVHHAYLFVGSRGTGKTSVAKILARSLNCVNGPTLEPCGECAACVAITNSTSLDVIEMDAASNNSVDDIRDLREKVGFAPTGERGWKVYILDEAHMLSGQAWNAFLKTLEEPPPRTTFVLATTEAHKVLATIVDRCHRFDFHRPSLEQITTVLKRIAAAEEIEADDRALAMIARSAGGSFRDAIGTLDQLVTYGGKQVSFEDVMELLDVADAELVFAATDAVIRRDPGEALRRVQELSESGRDPVQFMRDLTGHLRHLIVVQTIGEPPDSFSVTADQVPRLEGQARDLSQSEAVRAIDLLADAIAAVKEGADPRTQLELALLKAARPRSDASVEALLMRLERLEQGAPEGGTPGPAAPPPKRETEATPAASQQAESAPPAAPPPLKGEVEMERLWPAVLERVRETEGGEMMAALLAEARPLALEDDVLVLSYPASASFSKRKIEDRANGERLTQALRLVSGRPLAARFEIHDGPDGHDEPSAPAVRLTEDELIARFKSEFDAEDVAGEQEQAGEAAAAAEEN
jgi:DNA polymerase-3 subunit gamma/tau